MELVYKNLVFEEEKIMKLYLDNGWYAYTNDKETLFEGIKHSLDVIGVYDQEELVGLIRTIGDGQTIVFIQDILVLEAYHRKGIGSVLMKKILDKYPHVRQISLMTDPTEKTIGFYKSLGFVTLEENKTIGFSYRR